MDALYAFQNGSEAPQDHETFRDILRAAVTYDKAIRADDLAEESGVSYESIRSYMRSWRPAKPAVDAGMRILRALGRIDPRYVNEYLESELGFGRAVPLCQQSFPLVEIVPDGLRHFTVVAEVLKDQRIERPEEKPFRKACHAIAAMFGHWAHRTSVGV